MYLKMMKEDLNTVKDIADLLSMKVSQRAVMEVLNPVAASREQIVLKCKYELWFESNQDGDLISQPACSLLIISYYSIVLVADSS